MRVRVVAKGAFSFEGVCEIVNVSTAVRLVDVVDFLTRTDFPGAKSFARHGSVLYGIALFVVCVGRILSTGDGRNKGSFNIEGSLYLLTRAETRGLISEAVGLVQITDVSQYPKDAAQINATPMGEPISEGCCVVDYMVLTFVAKDCSNAAFTVSYDPGRLPHGLLSDNSPARKDASYSQSRTLLERNGCYT